MQRRGECGTARDGTSRPTHAPTRGRGFGELQVAPEPRSPRTRVHAMLPERMGARPPQLQLEDRALVYQDLVVFTGRAHPELAAAICARIGRPLGKADVFEFA